MFWQQLSQKKKKKKYLEFLLSLPNLDLKKFLKLESGQILSNQLMLLLFIYLFIYDSAYGKFTHTHFKIRCLYIDTEERNTTFILSAAPFLQTDTYVYNLCACKCVYSERKGKERKRKEKMTVNYPLIISLNIKMHLWWKYFSCVQF